MNPSAMFKSSLYTRSKISMDLLQGESGTSLNMPKMLISFKCLAILLALFVFVESEGTLKRSLSFSLISRKNQTGHAVTQVLFDKSAPQIPEHSRLSIEHTVTENKGIHKFHVRAIFTAPPKRPSDYELFPGVGYYKFHTSFANGFDDASSICTKEGGHLAIVNSESEHQVLQTIFARYPQSDLKRDYAFVGFHDRLKEGEFITIFGEPLNSTGFTRWSHPHQPDNSQGAEDCGSIHRNGGLNDNPCSVKDPFFCEYDLSWSDY